MTIAIVDSSVLDELLCVPGRTDRHEEALAAFAARQSREHFLLPLAVLFETGNHVAQASNGQARRACAERFVQFAQQAIQGELPFTPTPSPTSEQLRTWLDRFPERAMEGIGLVDLSLIALWNDQRALHRGRRIYIWSFDEHLGGYDTGP